MERRPCGDGQILIREDQLPHQLMLSYKKHLNRTRDRYHFNLEKGWDVNKGCTGSGGGVFSA